MKTLYHLVNVLLLILIVVSFFTPKQTLFAAGSTKSVFEPNCTVSSCPFTFIAPISFPGFSTPGTSLSGTQQLDVSKEGASTYLKGLYLFGVAIAAALAVLMITFGGVQYATTDAIQGKSDGKEKIKDAILGLLLALLSYTILNTINPNLVTSSFKPRSIDVQATALGGNGNPAVTPVTGGGLVDNNGSAYDKAALYNFMTGLTETGRGDDGRLTFTSYGYSDDNTPDNNSNVLRIGNDGNNPLSEGSVALSPDMINTYHPTPGSAVYINNVLVGYYDDSTGPTSVNTIDIYDPNKLYGGNDFMRNISAGQWTISFGEVRPHTHQ